MERLGALAGRDDAGAHRPRRGRARHQPLPARARPVLAGRRSRRSTRSARRATSARRRSAASLPVVQDTARRSPAPAQPVAQDCSPTCWPRSSATTGIERADGLPLLPGDGGQRLRLVRPLPARRPDRQPVLDVRDRARRPAARPTSAARPRAAASAAATGAARPGAGLDLARAPAAATRATPPAAEPQQRRAGGRAARRVERGRGRRRGARAASGLGAAPPSEASEPLLDYLFGGDELMRGRGRQHRRQPGADRRGDGARRARRRLPRPTTRTRACRSCPPTTLKAETAERGQPRARQRGADRRHARRLGRLDRASSGATTARASRVLGAQARALGRRRCRWTRRVLDPPALRARPEVRRDHARHVGRGLRGRRHDPARATPRPTPVEFDEFVNMFDDDDARGRADEPAASSATRSPAAARASTRRSARSAPLLRDVIPVAREPLRARDTNLAALRRASSPTPRAIVAPAAEAQAQLFVNLDRTFGALRERRAPVHPGVDLRGARRRSTRRSSRSRVQRPFLANTAALFRELQPGARGAARPPRRTSPTRSRSARRRCAAARRSTARLASLLDAVGDVRRGPARPARHQAPDRDVRARSNPTLQLPRAGADDLQLPRALVPQRRLAALRGRRQRHLAAVHHRRHAAGPEQRGRPVVGARRTGRRSSNHLHANPYPNTASPGPAAGVRGGQRALPRGPDGDRQRARARQQAATEGNALMAAARRRRARRSPFAVGLIALVVIGDPRLPRLHEGHPVHAAATRSRPCSSRRTALRPDSPVRIAGVDVGKVKKVDAAGGHGQRGRDDGDRRRRACRSTRTRRRRSARGSSSRATSSSTSSRARPARRSSTTATRSRSRRPRRRSSSTRC